jgi:thiol peroxidase
MAERKGVAFMGGRPMTLVGNELKIGDTAPEAVLTDTDFRPVKLSSFRGKLVILSTVLSLETSVCDAETRKFNERAAALGDDAAILTVSLDLPFTQQRWCGAAGIDKVQTLSDYREAALGKAFGVLMKEPHLLARTIFVIDKGGVIRYIQIVPEAGHEPDYDAALAAAKKYA